MSLRVAMRADASTAMGSGHVSRCLTLAEVIRARGGQVRFLGRSMPEHLRGLIESSGHECVLLGGSAEALSDLTHAAWLGTSQSADAGACVSALADASWDWMVVDHYGIDARWQTMIRAVVPRILAIDDLADRHHVVDVLLDQNLPADGARYTALVPPTCTMLLGPGYALVRESFRRARAQARPRSGTVTRVLVFVGGGDADNYTMRAVAACRHAGLGAGQADVVIGAGHPFASAVRSECDQAGYRCHVQTTGMAGLMAAADFAIGASGSASWERCALGLPTLTFSTALNQESILRGLIASGAVLSLPEGTAVTAESLAVALRVAMQNPERVRRMSQAAWDLVDAGGPGRVLDAMEAA